MPSKSEFMKEPTRSLYLEVDQFLASLWTEAQKCDKDTEDEARDFCMEVYTDLNRVIRKALKVEFSTN